MSPEACHINFETSPRESPILSLGGLSLCQTSLVPGGAGAVWAAPVLRSQIGASLGRRAGRSGDDIDEPPRAPRPSIAARKRLRPRPTATLGRARSTSSFKISHACLFNGMFCMFSCFDYHPRSRSILGKAQEGAKEAGGEGGGNRPAHKPRVSKEIREQ